MASLLPDCKAYIKDFNAFAQVYHDWAEFHDAKLLSVELGNPDDSGRHCFCFLKIGFSFDDYVKLKFTNVHSISTDIPDFRSSFFYEINFYVTNCCDYGECICMETDGDRLKIVAEYFELIKTAEYGNSSLLCSEI